MNRKLGCRTVAGEGRILEEDHTEQKQKADRQTIHPRGGERQRSRR